LYYFLTPVEFVKGAKMVLRRGGSKIGSFSKAQGTIEYLVLVAVVVVIGLVVVGLLASMAGSSEGIATTSAKIGNLIQDIGITESVVNPDGNFVVKLLNNSKGSITVSNVMIGDTSVSFSEDLAQGGSKFFSVGERETCIF
jgi:hypothetical protein